MPALDINYQNPISNDPLNQGLVGLWITHERNRGRRLLRDLKGSRHGTLTNMTASTVGKRASSGRHGGDGYILFDGSTSTAVVDCGDVLDIGTNSRSMSCWFRTASTADAGLMGKTILAGASDRFALAILGGSLSALIDYTSSGYVAASTAIAALADSKWHHAVYVLQRDATDTISLFVDGRLAGSNTSSAAPGRDIQSAYSLFFGCYQDATGTAPSSSYAFNGRLDDFRIWNRALTAGEVRELYQDARTGSRRTINRPPRGRIAYNTIVGATCLASASVSATFVLQSKAAISTTYSGSVSSEASLGAKAPISTSASGSVATSAVLSSAVAGSITTPGSLSAAVVLSASAPVSAQCDGSASTTAQLVAAAGISATCNGSTSVTGTLQVPLSASTLCAGVVSASAEIQTTVSVSTTTPGSISAAAALSATAPVSATSDGIVSTTAVLRVPVSSSASCDGSVLATATITAIGRMQTLIAASVNATATMQANAGTSALCDGQVSATARLTIPQGISTLHASSIMAIAVLSLPATEFSGSYLAAVPRNRRGAEVRGRLGVSITRNRYGAESRDRLQSAVARTRYGRTEQ